jgi:hypothetical protein
VRLGLLIPYPAYLAGHVPAGRDADAFIHVRPVVRDFQSRVVRRGGQIQVRLGAPESKLIYARLLAKIAHAYTVAELGLDPLATGAPSTQGRMCLLSSGVRAPALRAVPPDSRSTTPTSRARHSQPSGLAALRTVRHESVISLDKLTPR